MLTKYIMVSAVYAILSVSLFVSALGAAIVAPDLGACSSFALHGHAGVAAEGTSSTVYGNVGGDDSITGFGTAASISNGYNVYQSTDTASIDCAASKDIAYSFAENSICLNILPASNLAGLTLLPSVYCIATGFQLTTGALTLDGNGSCDSVFIFQTLDTIITSINTDVILINGAQATNIYWQSGSMVSLADYSTFRGTILAFAGITIGTGTTLVGRALAKVESVTLDGLDSVSLPTLSVNGGTNCTGTYNASAMASATTSHTTTASASTSNSSLTTGHTTTTASTSTVTTSADNESTGSTTSAATSSSISTVFIYQAIVALVIIVFVL
jgi:hypothetical protein